MRQSDENFHKQILLTVKYDPETGNFTRIAAGRGRGVVGESMTRLHSMGYLSVSVLGKKFLAHRLAWFYMTGKWPDSEIDHINRCRTDNRWVNLRGATPSENKQNIGLNSRSPKEGAKLGAVWCRGAYQSIIKVDGKSVYLGRHKTQESAHEAYMQAKRKLHPASTI